MKQLLFGLQISLNQLIHPDYCMPSIVSKVKGQGSSIWPQLVYKGKWIVPKDLGESDFKSNKHQNWTKLPDTCISIHNHSITKDFIW